MFLFLLTAAPLAYASVPDLAVFILALVSSVIFCFNFFCRQVKDSVFTKIKSNPFVLLGLIFALVGVIQLIPLPVALLKILSPATAHALEAYFFHPPAIHALSIYPWSTVFELIKFISYAMIFLAVWARLAADEGTESTPLTRRSTQNILRLGCLSGCLSILFHSIYDFNSHIPANALYFTVLLALACGPGSRGETYNRRFFKYVTDVILWIGLGIAIFAILQKFSFNGKIFWIGIKAPRPVGPYYNYDHFAGFMELCTPVAIASAVAAIEHTSFSSRKGWVQKILWFSTAEANRALRYLFFAMIMAATIFMSTSRGGIMSFCMTQVIFFSIIIFHASRRKKERKFVFLLISVAMLIAIFVTWLGPKEFLARFQRISIEKIIKMEGPDAWRLMFYRDTSTMIKDYPVIGTGLGTFGSAFPQYRKFDHTTGYLRYTHNDYLQLMAEMGAVVGGVLVLAFLILFTKEYLLCAKQLE